MSADCRAMLLVLHCCCRNMLRRAPFMRLSSETKRFFSVQKQRDREMLLACRARARKVWLQRVYTRQSRRCRYEMPALARRARRRCLLNHA